MNDYEAGHPNITFSIAIFTWRMVRWEAGTYENHVSRIMDKEGKEESTLHHLYCTKRMENSVTKLIKFWWRESSSISPLWHEEIEGPYISIITSSWLSRKEQVVLQSSYFGKNHNPLSRCWGDSSISWLPRDSLRGQSSSSWPLMKFGWGSSFEAYRIGPSSEPFLQIFIRFRYGVARMNLKCLEICLLHPTSIDFEV